MDKANRFNSVIAGLDKFYQDAAKGMGNQVYCHECREVKTVDPAECLRLGWPKCCGLTMSLDKPKGEVMEITIEQAMDRLRQAFNEDPDYRRSWKDNIACAVMDEFQDAIPHSEFTHGTANDAAERFLRQSENSK